MDNRHFVLFVCQMVVLFAIIVTALINLSIGHSENKDMWIALLSSSIGYLLPNPKYKSINKSSTAGEDEVDGPSKRFTVVDKDEVDGPSKRFTVVDKDEVDAVSVLHLSQPPS